MAAELQLVGTMVHVPGLQFVTYLVPPTFLMRETFGYGEPKYILHIDTATPAPDPHTRLVLKLELTNINRNAYLGARLRVAALKYIDLGIRRTLTTPRDSRSNFIITLPMDQSQRIYFDLSAHVINNTSDDRVIGFLSHLVRLSPIYLMPILKFEPKIPVLDTTAMITNLLRQEIQNEIQTPDSGMRVSLKCPISRAQMVVPCRSNKCTHFSCFDARNFFQSFERITVWRCPICRSNIEFEDLRIDEFYTKMLELVGYDTAFDYAIVDLNGAFSVHSTEREKLDKERSVGRNTQNNDEVTILPSVVRQSRRRL